MELLLHVVIYVLFPCGRVVYRFLIHGVSNHDRSTRVLAELAGHGAEHTILALEVPHLEADLSTIDL